MALPYTTEQNVKKIAKLVAEEVVEEKGSDIPTPTVEDAGKAIVVGDTGEYELENVGGGGTQLYEYDVSFSANAVSISDNSYYIDLRLKFYSSKDITFGNNLTAAEVIEEFVEDGEKLTIMDYTVQKASTGLSAMFIVTQIQIYNNALPYPSAPEKQTKITFNYSNPNTFGVPNNYGGEVSPTNNTSVIKKQLV